MPATSAGMTIPIAMRFRNARNGRLGRFTQTKVEFTPATAGLDFQLRKTEPLGECSLP